MPELAALGAMGFLACWIINLFALWRLRAQFQSSRYRTLQANLAKAELYWSEHRGELQTLNSAPHEVWARDQKRATQSLIWIGVGCAFASWAGVALMVVVLVSIKFLAKSRIEKALEGHKLGQQTDLTKEDVQTLVAQIQAG